MIALAALLAYLIGSLPTAGALGRLRGVDLRSEGSGNPGANNALRTAGPALAATVLLVEAGKGLAAVSLGGVLAGEPGIVAAGIAAAAGNVYNVWYGFEGGKGLGITLGILAGAWPLVLVPSILVIAIAALITRSAGLAALIAVTSLLVMSALWSASSVPTGGIEAASLPSLAVGLAIVLAWKHWRDSPLSSLARH